MSAYEFPTMSLNTKFCSVCRNLHKWSVKLSLNISTITTQIHNKVTSAPWSLESLENKTVFSVFLNWPLLMSCARRSAGRLFETLDPATRNCVLVRGIAAIGLTDERRLNRRESVVVGQRGRMGPKWNIDDPTLTFDFYTHQRPVLHRLGAIHFS